MTQLQCKECKKIIIEDIDKIDKKQEYIVCGYCGRQSKNPFYEND